jgi:hypothetical protein
MKGTKNTGTFFISLISFMALFVFIVGLSIIIRTLSFGRFKFSYPLKYLRKYIDAQQNVNVFEGF